MVGAILAAGAPLLIRSNAAERLATLFGAKHEEARESQEAREYLLKQSLLYTIQYPVFGVGLAQFSNFEGKLSKSEGKIGNWHETHNSLTEVSSECGVPALIFFVLGIGSALLSVNRVYRRARREGAKEIADACLCYLLAMTGFLTSLVFLANAFRFYLPAMIGLGIALSVAANRELSRGTTREPARMPGLVNRRGGQTRLRQPLSQP